MNPAILSLGLTIVQLAVKYGIPAAIRIVNGWLDINEGVPPTKEDFEALLANHRAPETFLSDEQRRILGLD